MQWYYIQHWDGVRSLMYTEHPPEGAVVVEDARVLGYLNG